MPNFRTIALDETQFWRELPAGCEKAFGLYLFCEGEATYCCSLTPSTWCEFLEHVFTGADPEDPFVQEHQHMDSGYSCYIRFLRNMAAPHISRDVECEDWGAAREYFQANAVEPAILMEHV